MPIAPAKELLSSALAGGYAVGYFEAWDMQSLEAVLTAAEAEASPAILGFGLMTADRRWAAGRAINYYGALAAAAGRAAQVSVSLILNEVSSLDQAKLGIELGFNIVMLEGAAPVEVQKELVSFAHARGVMVEAESGELPYPAAGVAGSLTDPHDAAAFVGETGVDILAVSVGNIHCGMEQESALDLERLAAIHEAVPVPLSLHGGSALPADCIPAVISLGVAKINVGTVLKAAYRDALARACSDPRKLADVQATIGSGGPEDIFGKAAAAVTEKVREFMRIYGSSGKA
jgi:fructose/tagatose bisphosphate aldolase